MRAFEAERVRYPRIHSRISSMVLCIEGRGMKGAEEELVAERDIAEVTRQSEARTAAEKLGGEFKEQWGVGSKRKLAYG